MPAQDDPAQERSLWSVMMYATMAGGMAWGIRGQYGHETGAMIAGLLVSLALTLLLCPTINALSAARAVALCTIAMGFGGSMTYGQTVGLTHDAPLIGNYAALGWGMLGLAIKGGLWIGFAGLFLGIGLSGVRYRSLEMLWLMLGAILAFVAGVVYFNEPFDPVNRRLPLIYFSDDWYWEPEGKLIPRREVWGGYVVALACLTTYCGWIKRDTLAPRMAGWGCLGGAIGFPLGQSLQSFHAWHHTWFASKWLRDVDSVINWWNFMETTFGAVMGAALACGLWINRRRIGVPLAAKPSVTMPASVEIPLMILHVVLLVTVEFVRDPYIRVGLIYGYGLGLGFIPIVCVIGGRWAPYLMLLPITAIPFAGKTVRQLVYEQHAIAADLGWALYIIFPLTVTTICAVVFTLASRRNPPARAYLRITLLVTAWLYFLLNYAFFNFPMPWETWTSRTPNAVVFTICLTGLTFLVWRTATPAKGNAN